MKNSDFLRQFIIVTLFLILATPLVLDASLFFPIQSSQNFYFRTLVEIIFAAYLFLAVENPYYRPKRSWILLTLTCLISATGLATFFSIDPSKSFWSTLERMDGFITSLHLFALFIVASNVLDQKTWAKLWKTSIALSTFIATISLLGQNLLGNTGFLGLYLLFHVFLGIFYYSKPIYAVSIALNTLAIYHSGSKGTMLALACGIFYILAASLYRQKPRLALWGIAFGSVVIFAISLFSQFSHYSHSFYGGRLLFLKLAFQGFF